MNIIYNIDSTTGLMSLKFKKEVLDPINNKDVFEKYILPIMAMNDKFCLTGSLSLKMLGFEQMDNVGDFDLALMEPLTENEYLAIKNFFSLRDSKEGYNWEGEHKRESKFDPNAHMWQLRKSWEEEVETDDPIDPNDPFSGLARSRSFKLDIFNDEMIRKKDVIQIYYDEFPIKLVHPSITLSYRMRYALDTRSTTTFKYWEKMKALMDNAKAYYQHIRIISKMYARVHEHNTNIEGNQDRINYIRELITRREYNMDTFFNKVFSETLDPLTLLRDKQIEQYKTSKQKQ